MSADEIIRAWKAEDDARDVRAPENPAGKQEYDEGEDAEDDTSTKLSYYLKCLLESKSGR